MIVFYLQTLSERFYPHPEIETSAVYCLDEDVLLQPDEVTINLIHKTNLNFEEIPDIDTQRLQTMSNLAYNQRVSGAHLF